MQKLKNQSGFVISQILAAIGALALLSIIAYGSYYAITKGTAQTTIKRHAGDLLSQAAYTLTTECADPDGDGFPESPGGKPGTSVPTGGFNIPDSSGAPKTDPWGTLIGYCPWDNGSVNSSTNRINGDTPGTQSSLVFAVVSAGPNKVFDTSCADIKAGTIRGDDGARKIMVSQVRQGVGGTVYYGDPVNNIAELNNLNTAVLKDGELRLVKSENKIYRWNSITSTWTDIGSGFWAKNGDHIYNTNTGFVGIGTQNPNNLIHVAELIEFNNANYSTKIGYQAGRNATGNGSTFLGYQAGHSHSSGGTGADNIGIGRQAFYSNTTGDSNVAVGSEALYANTSGHYNIAIGRQALRSNLGGMYNIAVGFQSLYSTGSPYSNIAIGYLSQFAATGSSNIGIGSESLRNATSSGNIAIGNNTIRNTTSSSVGGNIAIGHDALSVDGGRTNIAIGRQALQYNNSGYTNVAIGVESLRYNSTGYNNIGIGWWAGIYTQAGYENSNSRNSIFIGNNTRPLYSDTVNEIVIGYEARGAGPNTVVLGNDSIATTVLKGNVAIGTTNPGTYRLYVNGTAYSTGGWQTSDRRLKSILSELQEDTLEKVNKLSPIKFRWEKDKYPSKGLPDGVHYGLIAQEVEKMFPEIIRSDNEGYKAISYTELIPILIKAIQLQQKQIEKLKSGAETINNQETKNTQTLYIVIAIMAAAQIITIIFTFHKKN